MTASRRPILPVVALSGLLMLLAGCESEPGSGGRQGGLVDRQATDFAAETLDRGTIRLSSLKDKVVLLNFWGIWCRPCRFEVPELNRMHQELRPKGFQILAINFGDDRRDVARFVVDNQIRYPVVFADTLIQLYNIRAFPTNIVVDREGKVRFISEGYGLAATRELREAIEELL